MFLCWCKYLCALFSGIHTVAYAFPKVNIVTTAVDKEMNEDFHILPGIGKSCSLFLCRKYWFSLFKNLVIVVTLTINIFSVNVGKKNLDRIPYYFSGNFGDRYFGTDFSD